MAVAFFRRQRTRGPDDRRVRRQPELGVDVGDRLRLNAVHIDALVDRDDFRGLYAIAG